ncbi:hypothetical protein F5887DRAFT_921039 [Amanita rubescens]|nr:hypothetical protein F5887DRAFT_921039 [Amanita rubescens]
MGHTGHSASQLCDFQPHSSFSAGPSSSLDSLYFTFRSNPGDIIMNYFHELGDHYALHSERHDELGSQLVSDEGSVTPYADLSRRKYEDQLIRLKAQKPEAILEMKRSNRSADPTGRQSGSH